MDRTISTITAITLGFLLIGTLLSYAQSTAPAPAPAPAPDTAPTPPDFPEYIVTPREDLNPYDLSTMEKSQDMDYREGAGTLGTTQERKSNIEINEALKQKKAAEEKAKQEEKKKAEPEAKAGEAGDGGVSEAPGMTGPSAGGDLSTPGVRSGLFTWTDKDGVLHVTNDLGQVPIEYQVQALKGSNSLNLDKVPTK